MPLLLGPRTVTGTDTFTLAISGDDQHSRRLVPPRPASPRRRRLPTVAIGDATTSDSAPGTVTLTVTLTGNTTLPWRACITRPRTARRPTAWNTRPPAAHINFATGQTNATITVPILAGSQILSVHTQHGTENFTVQLSQPTDAVPWALRPPGTVTVAATPVVGQATFSVTGDSVSEGGAAHVTITRGGDLVRPGGLVLPTAAPPTPRPMPAPTTTGASGNPDVRARPDFTDHHHRHGQ